MKIYAVVIIFSYILHKIIFYAYSKLKLYYICSKKKCIKNKQNVVHEYIYLPISITSGGSASPIILFPRTLIHGVRAAAPAATSAATSRRFRCTSRHGCNYKQRVALVLLALQYYVLITA